MTYEWRDQGRMGSPVTTKCVICERPIEPEETFMGAGDGMGQAFAHRRCWKIVTFAQHYGQTKTLAEIIKEAATL